MVHMLTKDVNNFMTRIFIKTIKATVFIACYLFFANIAMAKGAKYDAFTVKVTGKGQPMLLIPGATCSGDEWKETVARYAAKYQCHVLTLAGYAGTTPLSKGPYLETIKKQIEQYIADQQLEHVILIGHSIGGFLSLCIGTELKAHLDKIVVVDAFPFFAGTRNPNAADTFSEESAKKLFDFYSSLDDKALKENQYNTAKFLCRDSTHWEQIATWGAASDRKTLAYTITEMMASDMRKKVSAITVPVLVMGAYCKLPQYPSYTRESVKETYETQYKACSTCTVHIAADNAKHFIMYDTPDWYFAELDNFLHN